MKTIRTPPAVLPETLHPEQRLKFPQVQALAGYGRSKIYAEIKADRFPKPERDGRRCSRWRAGDVLDWLRARRDRAARNEFIAAPTPEGDTP